MARRNRGHDGGPLGTDRESVGAVLNVDTGDDRSVLAQEGCPHPEMRVRRVTGSRGLSCGNDQSVLDPTVESCRDAPVRLAVGSLCVR